MFLHNSVIVKMEEQTYATVVKNVKVASLKLTSKLTMSFYFKTSWAPPYCEELLT